MLKQHMMIEIMKSVRSTPWNVGKWGCAQRVISKNFGWGKSCKLLLKNFVTRRGFQQSIYIATRIESIQECDEKDDQSKEEPIPNNNTFLYPTSSRSFSRSTLLGLHKHLVASDKTQKTKTKRSVWGCVLECNKAEKTYAQEKLSIRRTSFVQFHVLMHRYVMR